MWSCLAYQAMDCNKNFDSFPETSLILLAFLQPKCCQNSDLKRELDDLNENVKLSTNHNYIESDGEIQSDGHSFPADYKELLQELQQHIQPHLPVEDEQVQAAREMAAELIIIADLLEHRVLSQAAERLTRKLSMSPLQVWSNHLSEGVQSLLHHVPGAKEFNRELLEMAFTFALMKTVCEQTPHFLFKLYDTVVQYFLPPSPQ